MSKGQETERRILAAALGLFRKKGYGATTMRDVAAAADMSLGAAYHYFPSKQAIALRYFAEKQVELDAKVDARMAEVPSEDLATRLTAMMHANLDNLARDRKLLGALVPGIADVDEPLNPFSKELAEVRQRAIARFDLLLDGQGIPAELRTAAAAALWGLMMATILFFLHDRSPRQERSRLLVSTSAPLAADLLRLAGLPGLEALREKALAIARLLGV